MIIGAVIGALCRFGIYELLAQHSKSYLPTLIVNVVGSCLLGLYVQHFNGQFEHFFVIGLLSSFTTFSTFSVDCLKFMLEGKWRIAIYNIIGNIVFCSIALLIGLHI